MQIALTRPVRQVLASILLLGGTVVPTLLVGAVAWRIHQPGYVRDVEVTLGREIGARVTLEMVRYPRPGQAVYYGLVVRLDDPRAGGSAEFARLESLIVENSGTETSLIAEGLSLRGLSPIDSLSRLSDYLYRVGSDLNCSRLGLSANVCRIDLGAGLDPIAVEDLAIMLTKDSGSPKLASSFQIRDGKASTRCELTLGRDDSNESPRTTLTMKTMSGPPLPALALNAFFDVQSWLGLQAKCSGGVTMTRLGSADWTIQVEGELTEVDLGTLIGKRFPEHEFKGFGNVTIANAAWGERSGQELGWVDVRGRLTADRGSIGRGFLDSLRDQMHFRPVAGLNRLEASTRQVEFRGLGLAFELKPDGELVLNGGLGTRATPGAVLVSTNEVTPLLYAPTGASNVRGLIKALYPARAETLMPVTAESQALQRYLPLPVTAQAMVEPRIKAQ